MHMCVICVYLFCVFSLQKDPSWMVGMHRIHRMASGVRLGCGQKWIVRSIHTIRDMVSPTTRFRPPSFLFRLFFLFVYYIVFFFSSVLTISGPYNCYYLSLVCNADFPLPAHCVCVCVCARLISTKIYGLLIFCCCCCVCSWKGKSCAKNEVKSTEQLRLRG